MTPAMNGALRCPWHYKLSAAATASVHAIQWSLHRGIPRAQHWMTRAWWSTDERVQHGGRREGWNMAE